MMDNTLKGIAENPALFEAVKEIMRKKFSLGDLDGNTNVMILGEHVKARLQGLKLLEDGFAEIELYKTPTETSNDNMPAR